MSQAGNSTQDKSDIRDALNWYCHAIDRQELGALDRAFHSDATISYGVDSHVQVSDFKAFVEKRHSTIPKAFHMMGNVLIEFTANDTAFVESYCLAMEHHPEDGQGPVDRVIRVRYGDVFECRQGQWKIARRMTVIDHEMSVPVSVQAGALFSNDRYSGVRNMDDPIQQKRKTLGLL